jgi:hypothetical protein
MAVIEVNPGDFIQAAIDEANDNDTILVNPGTYIEDIQVQGASLIRIDKPLTVRSSGGPEVTILNGASAAERYYVVDIASNDVTLEGFTITNPDYIGTADASGIVTSVTGEFPFSNITVRDNIITEIGNAERASVDFGSFGVNAGPVNNLRLSGNRIFNIEHSDPAARSVGIFVYGNDALNLAENVTIEDNRVYAVRTPGLISEAITVGGDTKDFFIRRNRVEAPEEQASQVKRGIRTFPTAAGAIEISENTVRAAEDFGMRLESPEAQTVERNRIIGNEIGIFIADPIVVPPIILYNTFIENGAALVNDSEVIVSAENNFWGSAEGPTPGVDIIGPVEFIPFLQVPPGLPFVTTGPIANRPPGERPTRQLYVVIENPNDTAVTIQIQGYYLTNTQNLYVLEQIQLAPDSSSGSKVSRTYFANFDEFEFRFLPSDDRILISIWGLDANGQLVGPHRLVNNELTRFSSEI